MGITALLVSFLLALLAFANRRYEHAPPAVAVARRALAPADWLKWRFVANVHHAIDANNTKLETKSRLLTASLGGLLVSLLALGGYLVRILLQA
jgi:hypothetical protein